ncbi:hypothetical protein [Cupriavidus metallidurans]|uniref:hypothetical protein n=1 Tax=Cupriavidus metallidurans TaxID=119219 RepID=UPI001CCBD313|nr:hypothetical protein [Cupriavidus metallidurans]UBM12801.1 hypothetical protein LAI70_28010 [Cupriavidus metallidurans]
MSQQIAPGMTLLSSAGAVVRVKAIADRTNVAFVTIGQKGEPEPVRQDLWDMEKMRAHMANGQLKVVLDPIAVMA